MQTTEIDAPVASVERPSRFEPYNPATVYHGTFKMGDNRQRYETECIEYALSADDAAAIDECVQRGWITKETRTFFGDTVLHKATYQGKTRVAARLRELGFPED